MSYLSTIACFLISTLLICSGTVYGEVAPQQITPLKAGDKVLFIGNSFTEWSGPLPSAIQSLLKASGSPIDVTFISKVKGMGILKEYATWKSIGAMAAIQEGGWKIVVIQGWSDAIDRKDSETNEDGSRNADYLGYPECQRVMLQYFKVLDSEVKKIGAKTILYEPHVGFRNWKSDMALSAATYAILKDEVSCFHAPVINAWNAMIGRHPSDSASLLFAPDGGHQNSNGMALDAMTFYTILTGMSASGLKPDFPAAMTKPEFYQELSEIAYRTGKEILAANNCAIMDKENPASPKEVVVKNKLSDSFTLTWAPSTDDVGVLGYKVFMNEKEIGIAAKPMFSFGELVAEKTYSIKIIAFDSESKVSPPTTISVKTDKFSAVDNTGNLYAWDFTGLNGEGRMTAKAILPGMSASSPAGLVSIHLPLLPRVDFNNNALSARNSTATTLAQALAQEQYFSFTIAPLKGNAFSIKQIEMKFISEGPRNFTLMSKKKGFQVENAIGTYPDTPPVQSIAIAGHDKINSSTEFRIYVWGSDNQWTGFGLNGLAISGSVKSETLSPFQTSLSASNLSETGFVLSWKAVKNAKEYEVYIDAILLGKTASLNMPVRNLKIGSTYTMTVKAFDRVKDISEVSNPFSVVIPDLTKPSVPKNLTVSGLGTDSFILNWEAADDNVGVTWYEVSKNGLDGGTTAAVFMPEPYLSPNTSYDMKVRAKDAAGNFSEWSKPLKVKTLSAK